ncbi:50S ribosomal protein L32 [Gemella sp. GH3]|uniref:50S ribosomal protein L32 n=1 Tax=unclassified Gemella TaxID=2624949 RepID=UPI0015D0B6E6|nr:MULTISPECIES: 50S ribosomal protein L32 [unclassified Gemella]MBF0714182.1 50S ribosomal protein L32 [Gemella sp. GH3.1]NYS51134.1 50S ribosomal protein L32 [Gemella sp. GH3]
MAVPFRRTSKTAKRKRRTHKKLSAPAITLDAQSGNYVMGHRIDKKTGMYKGRQVLDVK